MAITTHGSIDAAHAIAQRAASKVPAYRTFLAKHGVATDAPFDQLPLTDKADYITAFPYTDLLGDDWTDSYCIFSSSGSSGHAHYWPQLKSSGVQASEKLQQYLERFMSVDKHRTLAVVGLALGSWIGGEHFAWALKNMALRCDYPFCVFAPGSNHDEIIDIIRRATDIVDRIVLFVCPSAIGHLLLRAQTRGQPLPLAQMRFVVLGEPFPETMRAQLQYEIGAPEHEPVILSVYGSADTGLLGVESPMTVALRRRISADPALADALGLDRAATPHLFHPIAPDALLETVNGELCVTRWQGIPLVRYNLHDAASLLPLSDIPNVTSDQLTTEAPVLLSITGRADANLILCGTNLSEHMLDHAVRSEVLRPWLTGAYHAAIIYNEGRQRLAFDLEVKPDISVDYTTEDAVYPHLIAAIGAVQPEFKSDWQNIYQRWDNDRARRILTLRLAPWPDVTEGGASTIKQRGVR